MDYRLGSVCKRTRLQESLLIKKFYEEKKKGKSGDQEKNVGDEFDEEENSRNTKNQRHGKGVNRSRKGGQQENYLKHALEKIEKAVEKKKEKNVGPLACDLKQNKGLRITRGSSTVSNADADDDVVVLTEERAGRRTYKNRKGVLDKKGDKDKVPGGNSDDGIVFLGEEVVSNGDHMDYRLGLVCKRTRLQESLLKKKFYEEKKKGKSGDDLDKGGIKEVKDVDSVMGGENLDGDQEKNVGDEFDEEENFRNMKNKRPRRGVNRSGKGGQQENYLKHALEKIEKAVEKKQKNVGAVGCDLKQNQALKITCGSNAVSNADANDDVVVLSEESAGRRTYPKRKGGLDKKGEKDNVSCGNSDDGIVFLGEEVVSNGNSSRVSSSLGSGLNSRCARVTDSRNDDPDEVFSSNLDSEKVAETNNGAPWRGQLRAATSDIEKDTHNSTIYVLSSGKSVELGKSCENNCSEESTVSLKQEWELSCEVDTAASDDHDFTVDESLRSKTKDETRTLGPDNREQNKDDSDIAKESCLKEKAGNDTIILSDDEEESCDDEDEDDDDDDDDDEDEDEDDDDDDDEDYEDEVYEDSDDNSRITTKRSVGKVKNYLAGLSVRPEAGKDVDVDFNCGDDGDSSKDDKQGNTSQKKKQIIEGGLSRRRALGLDVLFDCNTTDKTEGKSIAERIRPRLLSKSRKRKLEFGKYSCPLLIPDDDESESSSDPEKLELVNYSCPLPVFPEDDNFDSSSSSEDTSEEEYEYEKCKKEIWKRKKKLKPGKYSCPLPVLEHDKFESTSGSGYTIKEQYKDEKCKKEVLKRKKKRRSRPTCIDFVNLFDDSISDKEAPFEIATEQKSFWKFRFEDDSPALPEKAPGHEETEALFNDMELFLRAAEISLNNSSVVDNDNEIAFESETSPAVCCQSGKHDYVLDETIGLRCRYCLFVKLEMKYIFPPFAKDLLKKWELKDFGRSECSFLDKFQFQDSSLGGKHCSGNAECTVWDTIPGLRKRMHPHQREGFEFIWKNLAGGIIIKNLKSSLAEDCNGCIISHAPGTGKTCLAITFLLSFMKLFPACRPVIIAPCSMLHTWEEEFKKWNVNIPFYNTNKLELSGKEQEAAANILRQYGKVEKKHIRLLKLCLWKEDRGVLGMSYRLFERLAGEHCKKGYNEQIRKILLEKPGILVLDEGHTPRNDQSRIWKALSEVKTKRRIILSGTPFQNNFDELYNTLCLVNPKLADQTPSQGRGRGRRPRQENKTAKGKWDSLTSIISRNVGDRMVELRNMIDPFVHVYNGSILQDKLPGLRDSLLVLRPTAFQKNLLNQLEPAKASLRKTCLISLISIHPYLVSKAKEFADHSIPLKKLKSTPDAGVKTKFVMELIRLSESLHEKVLVFSEYIKPLRFIMKQLKSNFGWSEGREVLYMDGTQPGKQRQLSISSFNDPTSEVRVFLASTKACSEGINLVGGSRVILLDVVWNPSVERQAISRAYRLGQEKVVHVYRLITVGSAEVEKVACQNQKERLSKLVFSSRDSSNDCQTVNAAAVMEDKILELMVQHKDLQDIFEQILQKPKGYLY